MAQDTQQISDAWGHPKEAAHASTEETTTPRAKMPRARGPRRIKLHYAYIHDAFSATQREYLQAQGHVNPTELIATKIDCNSQGPLSQPVAGDHRAQSWEAIELQEAASSSQRIESR
jgi:hypothetical protein